MHLRIPAPIEYSRWVLVNLLALLIRLELVDCALLCLQTLSTAGSCFRFASLSLCRILLSFSLYLSLYRCCLFSLNPKSIELVAPLSHGLPCALLPPLCILDWAVGLLTFPLRIAICFQLTWQVMAALRHADNAALSRAPVASVQLLPRESPPRTGCCSLVSPSIPDFIVTMRRPWQIALTLI